jgi:hypothetical protein
MRRISCRKVAAIGCSVAACSGAFASIAQATGPGTGQGLVPLTLACQNLAGTKFATLTFALAATAGNKGGAKVGALIDNGGAQLPLGEWLVLGISQSTGPSFTLADFTPLTGQRIGLLANQLVVCTSSANQGQIPTLLVAPAAGLK